MEHRKTYVAPAMELDYMDFVACLCMSAPEEPDLGGGGEGSGSDDPDAKDRGEWGDIWNR